VGQRKNSVACIVSPNAADADLAVRFLQREAIEARAYANLRQLGAVLDESAGCLVLVEEALVASDIAALREAIAALPAWCDLPLILVARNVAALASATATVFPESGNVALLERPLNPHTLVSAVQVALRASGRQRQVGELIAQRDKAVKLREEFIAMLAHELRNPLAPMRNALYIMRTRQLEDPVVLKSTEILDRQVNHVARLVDDLMDVARLGCGSAVCHVGRPHPTLSQRERELPRSPRRR
jgi:signal transduction histidine kinase